MDRIYAYRPYDNWRTLNIIEKQGKRFLKIYDFFLEINEDNYMPKAGLLFDEILKDQCKDKRVLDLGCGQLGILGIMALHYGAKEILATDVDKKCVNWLKKIIKNNNIKKFSVVKSNMFSKIDNKQKFDLILSNPPHMPMKKGKKCDSGGLDGRYYIKRIITNSINYLNDGGELNMMMLDFLGIDKSYNNDESIYEFARKQGYHDMKIIYKFKRKITPGSVTYESLDYIKKVYPKYKFDEFYPECNIVICNFKK